MAANSEQIVQALRDMPRKDNASYHRTVHEARQAHDYAERQLGGPVVVEAEYAQESGCYTVTFRFRRQDAEGS